MPGIVLEAGLLEAGHFPEAEFVVQGFACGIGHRDTAKGHAHALQGQKLQHGGVELRAHPLMTGFFAAQKGNPAVKEILDYYDRTSFYNPDGSMQLTPNPVIFARETARFGLVFNGQYQEIGDGMRIFPNEVFGGYNVYDMIYTITENTVLVHHYTASWRTVREEIPVKLKKLMLKLFGVEFFRFMRRVKHKVLKIEEGQK